MHVLAADEHFVETAKARSTAEREIAVSAEHLFATLEDAPSWVPGMREAIWTSPKPFGKGTTRIAKLMGGVTVEEVFWAWEPNRRMGLHFTATSIGWLSALAELYEITPLPSERCNLRWTLAVSFRGVPTKIEPVFGRALTIIQKLVLKRLERIACEHPTSA